MIRIAFLLDSFELQSPAQQLLDRFLIGYNHDGEFKANPAKVLLSLPRAPDDKSIQARREEFGLEIAQSDHEALSLAEFAISAPGTKQYRPALQPLVPRLLSALRAKKPLYLDAALLLDNDLEAGLRDSTSVLSSRAASHLIPLPIKPAFNNSDVQRALVVVHGSFPEAELDALHAIKPYLPPTWLQRGLPPVQPIQKVWDFAYTPHWRHLLAAAISRSTNIQGDPERDGRTQDVVGLQLLEKLAPAARGWHIKPERGGELGILVLDGAVADFSFAVQTGREIHSAELYHPQSPMADHYSDLAAWIHARFSESIIQKNLNEALFLNQVFIAMKRAHQRA